MILLKMKQFNYIFPVFLFITFFMFSVSSYSQILVDAKLDDWGDLKNMQYDKENNIYYAFKKDNQFLYMSLLKKEHPDKYFGGGVQLFFSEKKGDTTALQLLFGNMYKDTVTRQTQKYTHDFFTIKNLKPNKTQLLATNNETGISVEWNITNIEFLVIENGILNTRKTPPNPNIFTAEIQIPLEYLKKYIRDQSLSFCIAMRGSLFNYKPKMAETLRQISSNPTTEFDKENLEYYTPTAFFSTLNLSKF